MRTRNRKLNPAEAVAFSHPQNQKDSVSTLNDSAMEVLGKLDTEGAFDHLFINKKTRKPYTTISKQWDIIRTAAGLPHLRIHDLRHQFAVSAHQRRCQSLHL
jgi:integrase